MKLEKMTLEDLKEILEKQTHYEYEIIPYWEDTEIPYWENANIINVKGLKKGDKIHIEFSNYKVDTMYAKNGARFISTYASTSTKGNGTPLNSVEELVDWLEKCDGWFGYKIPRKRKQLEQLSLF